MYNKDAILANKKKTESGTYLSALALPSTLLFGIQNTWSESEFDKRNFEI